VFLLGACSSESGLDTTQYTEFKYGKFDSHYPKHSVKSSDGLLVCEIERSCGAASIAIILNTKFLTNLTEQETRDGILTQRHIERNSQRGISFVDMKYYLNSLGIEAGGFKVSKADFTKILNNKMPSAEFPMIIPVTYGGFKRYAILNGSDSNYAYVGDTAFGYVKVTHTDFFNIIDDLVVLLIYGRELQSSK